MQFSALGIFPDLKSLHIQGFQDHPCIFMFILERLQNFLFVKLNKARPQKGPQIGPNVHPKSAPGMLIMKPQERHPQSLLGPKFLI